MDKTSAMNDEIKKMIEDIIRRELIIHNVEHIKYPVEQIYSLISKQLQEKDKEIELLAAEKAGWVNTCVARQFIIERNEKQLQEQSSTIERLKTLLREKIEDYAGYKFDEKSWQQFKTENNL